MSVDDVQIHNYMQQLYEMSGGDVSTEVSMYDIGAALGMDRSEAGALAEDLIIDGYAELKNLTGGICITSAGLQLLNLDTGGPGEGQDEGRLELGEAEVLTAEQVEAVEDLVGEIRVAIAAGGFAYTQVEELVIDLKTLQIQLLSSRPKTDVVRAILGSLVKPLEKQPETERLGIRIKTIIGSGRA